MKRTPNQGWAPPVRRVFCLLSLLLALAPFGVPAAQADTAWDRERLLRTLDVSRFRPPDEQRLRQAASQLKAAFRELQQQRGRQDRDQLEWLGIPESSDAPLAPILQDPPTLRQIQWQLEQDFEPFEQDVYQRLHAALQQYRRLLRAREQTDLKARFERRLAALRTLLERAPDPIDATGHRRIARHVVWLQEHLQAEPLVAHLREELSFPNVVVRIPRESLITISEQTLRRDEPLRQQSGPLRTSGRSVLEGTVRVVPQSGDAPLRLGFPGTVTLRAVNQLGPYRFSSRATTRLEARMDLALTAEGLRTASSPSVAASTRLVNGRAQSACGGPVSRLGGRVVDRLIARRAGETAGQISATVSERIREEFTRLAAEQLAEANQEFRRLVLDRATRMQMTPRLWNVTGSDDHATLRLTVDRQSGLAAPGPLPADNRFEGPAVSMHETFVTELANAAFRGQNFPTELDANALQSFNDQLPVPLFEVRDFLAEPRLRVVLHPRRPLQLRFKQNLVELQLRVSRMELAGETLEDSRLSLAFRLQPHGESIVVRREGEPRVSVAEDREVEQATIEKFEQAARDELLAAMKRQVELATVLTTESWTVRPDRLHSAQGWFTVVGRFGPPSESDESEESGETGSAEPLPDQEAGDEASAPPLAARPVTPGGSG